MRKFIIYLILVIPMIVWGQDNCPTYLPVSVAINGTASTICSGAYVTYMAYHVNGGTSPQYQWRVNFSNITGATNSTYTYQPLDGDVISCVVTSSYLCVTNNPAYSNSLMMMVNPNNAVIINISATENPVCTGSTMYFTSSITNGGTAPQYQWKNGGVNISGATLNTYSYTPTNGDVITCQLTSNVTCPFGNPAQSNSIIATTTGYLTPSVDISATSTDTCAGANITFTATPVNGGGNPTYKWIKNGSAVTGATNSTYSYIPENNDVIKCRMVSSISCATPSNVDTSDAIVMDINVSVPVIATIWATNYAVIQGQEVTFYANVENGGSNPIYQWVVDGVNVGSNLSFYSFIPVNNQNIYCVITSDSTYECFYNNPDTSNIINMIVYTTGTPCATPTVEHGGKTYNTVQIGTQCWLRENIDIGEMVTGTQTNNSIIEKFCYNNDTNNCNIYGGLYQWAEAVQYVGGVTNTTHWGVAPVPVQGVCPPGWHIPRKEETTTLIVYLTNNLAGIKLKEKGYAHWGDNKNNMPWCTTHKLVENGKTCETSPNWNSTGFTALPSGMKMRTSGFWGMRFSGFWWTITKGDQTAGYAKYVGVNVTYDTPSAGESYKTTGLPIRCLKD